MARSRGGRVGQELVTDQHCTKVGRRGRSWLMALALGVLGHGCSADSSDEGPRELACETDGDCEEFGASARCLSGSCASDAIRCAREGGLDPAERTGNEDVPTFAAVLGEWLVVAETFVADYCDQEAVCTGRSSTAACLETGLGAVGTTCCRATVDSHLTNRAASMACPVETECGTLTPATYCPALKDFESLCE